MNNQPKEVKMTSIGGQALIEGIMMRGPGKVAVSVRLPDGTVDTEYLDDIPKAPKFLRAPIVRGVYNYIQSMRIGYKALMMSAEKSGLEDKEDAVKTAKTDTATQNSPEEAKTPVNASEADAQEASEDSGRQAGAAQEQASTPLPGESVTDTPFAASALKSGLAAAVAEPVPKVKNDAEKKEGSKFFTFIMTIAAVLGVAIALVLFMYVPALIFNWINGMSGEVLTNYRALFEGVMKIIIFVAYLMLVTLMNDIKRTFQYHGAEHKTIFCYEHGEELTVENARKYIRFHPRCGTSFLVLMLLVSIAISAAISIAFPALTKITALWVAVKILIIPIICGIGYELIKFCGRHDNLLTRIISAPGKWMQRITTKEPDDSMLEVAIEALKAVIPASPDEDKW